MNTALRHRGPDDEGVWISGNAGLAARRLSIIDVEHGHQPMTTEDGRFTVVFNGEIYNAPELREELRAKGHAFRTRCDTEVVLEAFAAYGDEAVERFNGMFAIAVYEPARRRLLLVRDRVGIKPLCYTFRGGTLAFSSEIDSLLRSGLVTGRMDPAALDAYFTYLYVPGDRSIFQDVKKLAPGERVIFEDGVLRRERYWRPELRLQANWTLDTAAEAFLELLDDAIRLRTVSDVPLGAFLSGGVDSSAIVGRFREGSGNALKTFTIGFTDPQADETGYARIASDRFGTEHTESVMTPDLVTLLPELIPYFGEPFADSSAVPTWLVSKLAREQVTVALSGDGGDELFAGYTWAHMNHRVAQYRRVPALLRQGIDGALRGLPGSGWAGRVKRFSTDSFLDPRASFLRRQTCFGEEMRNELYGDDLRSVVARATKHSTERVDDSALDPSDPNWMLERDLRVYLPDDILTKVDRMSMAASLEVRVPMLDHRIVEFAMTVPFALKFSGGVSKRLLKHAIRDTVPQSLLTQRKRGFSLPIHRWFRGELGDQFQELLLTGDARCGGYLNMDSVRTLYSLHSSGTEDMGHHLWTLLSFEHWLRYVESVPGVHVDL